MESYGYVKKDSKIDLSFSKQNYMIPCNTSACKTTPILESQEHYFNFNNSFPTTNFKQLNNNGKKESYPSFNSQYSPKIVKLYEYFLFRNHLCIVIELLDASLYELLKITEFKGIALSDIALYSRQILEGLIRTEREGIIHCDLKPENILFVEYTKNKKTIVLF